MAWVDWFSGLSRQASAMRPMQSCGLPLASAACKARADHLRVVGTQRGGVRQHQGREQSAIT